MATMTIDTGEANYHVYTAITGTSANSYPGTAQAQWTKAYLYNAGKTIYIENSGATNSITVKVVAKPSPNTTDEYILPDNTGADEPTILLSTYALYSVPEAVHTINIYVKSTSAGNHSTFKIIASGYRTD